MTWFLTASYGTVGLVEVIWVYVALFGLYVLTGALWRDCTRWGAVRHQPYSYRRQAETEAAINFAVRHLILWLVLLPCAYVGILSMFTEPSSIIMTREAEIATLILVALEVGLVTSAIHDEYTHQRIGGWMDLVVNRESERTQYRAAMRDATIAYVDGRLSAEEAMAQIIALRQGYLNGVGGVPPESDHG